MSGNMSRPCEITLKHASRLAIINDMPIMMDYWTDSLEKKVLIGLKSNEDKLLVKSEEEYTSTINKLYKSEDEYILQTENSIYIVSKHIDTKRIT